MGAPGTTLKAFRTPPVLTSRKSNKERVFIGAFASHSPWFHDPSVEGYAFVADQFPAVGMLNP
jgi:hypothetical protein